MEHVQWSFLCCCYHAFRWGSKKNVDSVGFALTKDVHLKPHDISMARAAWKALRQDLLKDVSALGLLQGDRTALRVLQEREGALRVTPSNSSFQQAKLASLLDLKGEHLKAKELLKGCSTSTCQPGEQAAIGFLQHLVLQHVRWQEERAMITDTNSVAHIRHVPVETVSAQVSGEEIWERFVKPGIPCVIRGVRLAPLRTLDDLAPLGSVQIPMRPMQRKLHELGEIGGRWYDSIRRLPWNIHRTIST